MSCKEGPSKEGPSKEGYDEPGSVDELLRTSAWEVRESPVDLGSSPEEDWPKLQKGWKLGPVADVASDSRTRVGDLALSSEALL